MSEKISDFKFVHISNVYSINEAGQLISQVNWKTETDLDLYVEVWGTLTFTQHFETPDAEGALRAQLCDLAEQWRPRW